MSLVKKIETNGVVGKFYKDKVGYYFKIYYNKKVIAQMYYYGFTLEIAEKEFYKTLPTLDLERLEKL